MSSNNSAEFAIKLTDDVSKNADKAEKSLKGLKSGLSEAEKAEKRAEEASKSHADAMKRVGEASQGAWINVAQFAVAAGAAVAATAAAMVVAAEKWAIEASEFQTRSLAAFEAIDGTGTSAKRTLDSLRGMANGAGLPTEKLTEFYKELRLSGLAVEQVQDILNAGLDVSAVLGDQAGKGLIEAVKGLREKGKLSAETLGHLKGAGIGDSDEFFQVLTSMQGSASFGKTKQEIEKLLQDGKIDADTGTKAILEIVSNKLDHNGPLGSIAKEIGGNSISGQLTGLKNQLNSVFAESAVTGPFIEALKSINKLLDPTTESGQKIRDTLGRAFQGVADWVSKIKPEDIEQFLNGAIRLADAVIDLGSAFSNGLMKGLEPVLKPFQQLTGDSEGAQIALAAIGATVEWLAEFVGAAFGSMISTFTLFPRKIAEIASSIADVWDVIPKSWDELTDWFDSIDLFDIGQNIVDGLWDGIKDGWRWLLESIEGLLDLLPAAAKKALGIASPSKVFAEIGGFVGEGFAAGIGGENDNAREAVEELVEPPPLPTLDIPTIAGGPVPQVQERGGVTIENLSIVLNLDGGNVSESAAQGFARAFAREFRVQIQDLNAQSGEETVT